MEMEINATKLVEEIIMQAKENQEEFIFETIQPYCENILQMKINKEELKQILLAGIQKQQPSEDCISRQAVLEYIEGSEAELGHSSENELVCQDIKEFPPVTPQPKTGHWIDEGFYAEGHSEHAYRCSECDEHYIGYVGEYKYCPTCGSYNGGGKNDTN